MTINAIRIAEDGTVTEHTLAEISNQSLDSLQTLVGGWIEGISSTNGVIENDGMWAYCHEEGRLIGLEVNATASIMFGHTYPYPPLVGPIVVTHVDDYDEETDKETSNPPLTPEQIALVTEKARAAQTIARALGFASGR